MSSSATSMNMLVLLLAQRGVCIALHELSQLCGCISMSHSASPSFLQLYPIPSATLLGNVWHGFIMQHLSQLPTMYGYDINMSGARSQSLPSCDGTRTVCAGVCGISFCTSIPSYRRVVCARQPAHLLCLGMEGGQAVLRPTMRRCKAYNLLRPTFCTSTKLVTTTRSSSGHPTAELMPHPKVSAVVPAMIKAISPTLFGEPCPASVQTSSMCRSNRLWRCVT